MPQIMTLIPGRSNKQGTSLNAGKLKDEYREVTSTVEINAEDMARLGLKTGDKIRLRSTINAGSIIVTCKERKVADLPSGLMFIAYGPMSSELMEGDTAGTGMPLSKHLSVEVEGPISVEELVS